MVVGMDMVTRMMIYNKQTCKYAAMYSKRRLPYFTQLVHRPTDASLPLKNTRDLWK
jgi:hypothetical protein